MPAPITTLTDLSKQYKDLPRAERLKVANRDLFKRTDNNAKTEDGISSIINPGEVAGFLELSEAGKIITRISYRL